MNNQVLIAEPARRWSIAALLLATAVRLYLVRQHYCINSDGVFVSLDGRDAVTCAVAVVGDSWQLLAPLHDWDYQRVQL